MHRTGPVTYRFKCDSTGAVLTPQEWEQRDTSVIIYEMLCVMSVALDVCLRRDGSVEPLVLGIYGDPKTFSTRGRPMLEAALAAPASNEWPSDEEAALLRDVIQVELKRRRWIDIDAPAEDAAPEPIAPHS